MKKLLFFMIPNCPYCNKAKKYISELKEEKEEYANIHIELCDEKSNSEFAEKYDYYYVPTFYVENKKLHEGAINKKQMAEVFDKFLQER